MYELVSADIQDITATNISNNQHMQEIIDLPIEKSASLLSQEQDQQNEEEKLTISPNKSYQEVVVIVEDAEEQHL